MKRIIIIAAIIWMFGPLIITLAQTAKSQANRLATTICKVTGDCYSQ